MLRLEMKCVGGKTDAIRNRLTTYQRNASAGNEMKNGVEGRGLDGIFCAVMPFLAMLFML